jgi:GNAT superfamily N-acetyltransferase
MSIRPCQKEDIQTMLDLVIELAVFEKEPEAVTATIEEYYDQFEKGLYNAFVAEIDGKVVGMACYYFIFSTWKGKCIYLEDFVVSADYRSYGIGQKLWDAMLQKAKDEKCAQMRWQVLDWNQDAIRFYEKNNAAFLTDWWNGRLNF